MKSSKGAIEQIVAFILIVFVTFVWIFFFMIDYWSLVKLKDKLDIATQEAAHWLSQQKSLDESNMTTIEELKDYLNSMFHSQANIHISRVSDLPKGEIDVQAQTIYKMHNLLGERKISSHFRTFSFYDQNGSYSIEIQ